MRSFKTVPFLGPNLSYKHLICANDPKGSHTPMRGRGLRVCSRQHRGRWEHQITSSAEHEPSRAAGTRTRILDVAKSRQVDTYEMPTLPSTVRSGTLKI